MYPQTQAMLSGGGGGSQARSLDAQPATSLIQESLNASCSNLDNLHGITKRLEAIADRLMGPIPQGVSKGENSSDPAATMPALQRALMFQAETISRIIAQIDRIERL